MDDATEDDYEQISVGVCTNSFCQLNEDATDDLHYQGENLILVDGDRDEEIHCNEELAAKEKFIYENLLKAEELCADENCPPDFLREFYLTQINSIQT